MGSGSAREGLEKNTANPLDLIIINVIMEYDSAGNKLTKAGRFREGFWPVRNVPVLTVSRNPADPAPLDRQASEKIMIAPDAYLTNLLSIPASFDRVWTLLDLH